MHMARASCVPLFFLAGDFDSRVPACAASQPGDELCRRVRRRRRRRQRRRRRVFTFFNLIPDTRACSLNCGPDCGNGFFVSRANRSTTQCGRGPAQSQCKVQPIDWSGTAMPDVGRERLRGRPPRRHAAARQGHGRARTRPIAASSSRHRDLGRERTRMGRRRVHARQRQRHPLRPRSVPEPDRAQAQLEPVGDTSPASTSTHRALIADAIDRAHERSTVMASSSSATATTTRSAARPARRTSSSRRRRFRCTKQAAATLAPVSALICASFTPLGVMSIVPNTIGSENRRGPIEPGLNTVMPLVEADERHVRVAAHDERAPSPPSRSFATSARSFGP